MAIEAKHTNIKSLIMGDLDQFHIPIYQRSYAWGVSGNDNQVDRLSVHDNFQNLSLQDDSVAI